MSHSRWINRVHDLIPAIDVTLAHVNGYRLALDDVTKDVQDLMAQEDDPDRRDAFFKVMYKLTQTKTEVARTREALLRRREQGD